MHRALLLLTVLAAPAWGRDGKNAQAPGAEPPAAEAALDRLKSLSGDWRMAGLDGVQARWAVTGGGRVVTETLFPGTAHEMLTVYHLDGDALVLTHYCASGNQPRMRAAVPVGDTLVFSFDGGTHVDPAATGHMHDATLELVDADTLREAWSYWEGGQQQDVKRFELVRVAP